MNHIYDLIYMNTYYVTSIKIKIVIIDIIHKV